MPAIKFVALDTDLVSSLRDHAPDANGHRPERRISGGGAIPCRHSLRNVPDRSGVRGGHPRPYSASSFS